jgi:NAD-dependent DNA ligase
MKHLTLESVAEAMLGNGGSFKDVYYPDLIDCVDELTEFIKKKVPGGLTRVMIERNGYKKWGPCLKEAPNLKTDFGKIVLNAWISFFFEYPELMELVGIIAEQENPKADPEVVKGMRELETGTLITKSDKRGPLTGMKVVFTGASSYFKGEAMERFLEKNGAITSHTVTSSTELLITGSRPASSKLVKAKNNGVRIIKEEDFINEFKGQLVGLP